MIKLRKRKYRMKKPKYVSIGAYDQVRWERDIAIDQLKELGYEFGEKIRDEDKRDKNKDSNPSDKYVGVTFLNVGGLAEYLSDHGVKQENIVAIIPAKEHPKSGNPMVSLVYKEV